MASAVAAVAALAVAAGSASASGGEPVGQVSLLIGAAQVIQSDGHRVELQRGSPVHVGDRIETGPNGHVHLRFVDNALVSVRPESVMQIQAYHYDPRRPESSEVRLKLDKGSGRSLSGDTTSVDKSRFRLNTPVAAIGVRGTDFVVHTDAQEMRAMVADGTIVVSPYGTGCSAAGLGPCSGLDARELSAGMGRWIAQVRPGERGAQLVPAADLAAVTAALSQDRQERAAGRQQGAIEAARTSGLLAAEPNSVQQRANDQSAAELLTVASTQLPELNRPSRLDSQLIWGRWTIPPDANDRLTVPFALARLDRHVTVADVGAGLFRSNPQDGGALFAPSESGVVGFRLSRASAVYDGAGGIEPAAVLASNLTVDFGRRTFATALDLAAGSGPTARLRLAGDLRVDGLFAVGGAQQRVAGALSADGREAGYLFEVGPAGQLFRGRTLWNGGP